MQFGAAANRPTTAGAAAAVDLVAAAAGDLGNADCEEDEDERVIFAAVRYRVLPQLAQLDCVAMNGTTMNGTNIPRGAVIITLAGVRGMRSPSFALFSRAGATGESRRETTV